VRRQQRGTYLPASNPYLPFFAALCAHLVAAALLVILPSMTFQPPPEQVVTINLADMPAPAAPGGGSPPKPQAKPAPPVETPAQPPPQPAKIQATPVKEKPPEPEPPKKIAPKPVKEKPEPPPPPQPPPPKAVSLKPQQVKKVPPEPPKKKDTQAVKRDLDKIREQLTKEKQRQDLNKIRQQLVQEDRQRDQRKRDQAAAEARAAQAEADRLTRQLEGQKAMSRLIEAQALGLGSGAAKSNQSDSAASSGANSALENQYYSRIASQLQSYWKLPDYKDWPANLLAKVVVTLDKSGKILDVQFEKRSGDGDFDRLVKKTLDDADPLPPIPPALKKERLEIGFNFTPGSITGR